MAIVLYYIRAPSSVTNPPAAGVVVPLGRGYLSSLELIEQAGGIYHPNTVIII